MHNQVLKKKSNSSR